MSLCAGSLGVKFFECVDTRSAVTVARATVKSKARMKKHAYLQGFPGAVFSITQAKSLSGDEQIAHGGLKLAFRVAPDGSLAARIRFRAVFIDDSEASAAVQCVNCPVDTGFAIERQHRVNVPGPRRIGHIGRLDRLEPLFVVVDAHPRNDQPGIAVRVALSGTA